MTKLLLGSALAALAIATPGIALAQSTPAATIIIVDRNRIANECNACRNALTQLQGMVTNLQTRQQQLSAPLNTEAQTLQQQADAAAKMPAGAARTAAENQLQTRLAGYQQRERTANQELQGLDQNIQSTRANVMNQIMEKLDPIIVNVMRTRNASIAVDKGVTIAISPALDVTNDVMNQFNTQVTSLSVTPMPQQQPPAAAQRPAPTTPQPQGR